MLVVSSTKVGGATVIPSPAGWKPYLFAPYSTTRTFPVSSVYPYLPLTSPFGSLVSILKDPSAPS